MTNTSLAKTFKVALLGCVIALGATRTADAAYVVINADPDFGSAFPSLGWRAVGAIYVPDTCLSALPANINSNVFVPQQQSDCAGIQMQDVKVGLYDLAAPNVILQVLSVGTYGADLAPPPDSSDALTQKLQNIGFVDGQVDSFSTTLSTPVQATIGIAGGGNNYFSLEFSSTGSRLVAFGAAYEDFDDAVAISQYPPQISISRFIADVDYRAPGFSVSPVQTVPEPASLALVSLALGTAALALRRRRG